MLYGTRVAGTWMRSEVYNWGNSSQCGGIHPWKPCVFGELVTSGNIACFEGENFPTHDSYRSFSSYRPQEFWSCALPSRKAPCRSRSNPTATGVTMWNSLPGGYCSAECDVATKGYTAPVKCGGSYTCYKLHLRWVLVSKKSSSPNKELLLTSSVTAGDLVDVPTGLKVGEQVGVWDSLVTFTSVFDPKTDNILPSISAGATGLEANRITLFNMEFGPQLDDALAFQSSGSNALHPSVAL
eukprot:gene6516-6743_t